MFLLVLTFSRDESESWLTHPLLIIHCLLRQVGVLNNYYTPYPFKGEIELSDFEY